MASSTEEKDVIGIDYEKNSGEDLKIEFEIDMVLDSFAKPRGAYSER